MSSVWIINILIEGDKVVKNKKNKNPKPRNPFVQHLVSKRQGVHEKPYKVERTKDKAKIKKSIFPS
jgi:hypothetical protein